MRERQVLNFTHCVFMKIKTDLILTFFSLCIIWKANFALPSCRLFRVLQAQHPQVPRVHLQGPGRAEGSLPHWQDPPEPVSCLPSGPVLSGRHEQGRSVCHEHRTRFYIQPRDCVRSICVAVLPLFFLHHIYVLKTLLHLCSCVPLI